MLIDQLIKAVPNRLQLATRYNVARLLGERRNIDIMEQIECARRRCVDVGTDNGLCTYRLAQMFNAVEAFEPLWDKAIVISNSRLRNVHLHNVALSECNGYGRFKIGGDWLQRVSAGNHFGNVDDGRTIIVRLRTMDSFHYADVDLIRIDVKGRELDVIAGAIDTIAENRPVLLMTIEQQYLEMMRIEAVLERVRSLHYDCKFVMDGELRPIREFSLDRHQKYVDPSQDEYVKDFVFQPR
ncbi:MAG: FkbM family methyltransferase [Betaproteobacteria bacterium]